MWIFEDNFKNIIKNKQVVLDVRSETEFSEGSIPLSVNVPILKDAERVLVGTCYKQQGREAAISLGQSLVQKENKEEKIKKWVEFVKIHPNLILTCFRGGLRSGFAQQWLQEIGLSIPRIKGGTKSFRQFLINEMSRQLDQKKLLVISGETGSGKTEILQNLKKKNFPVLDLEELAQHRGSAFGRMGANQPSQIDFENLISQRLILTENESQIAIEDESRMIGSRTVPENLFTKMRSNGIYFIQEPVQTRAQHIFEIYIKNSAIGETNKTDKQTTESALQQFDQFILSTQVISRKLGGLKSSEIVNKIKDCKNLYLNAPHDIEANLLWIEDLLNSYYDPLYRRSLEKRNPKVIFRGSRTEVEEQVYLKGKYGTYNY